MSDHGKLIGISVGPGDPGLITVKGLDALRDCHVLFVPQAKGSDFSVAKSIVDRFEIEESKFRPIFFEMDRSRQGLAERYADLAEQISTEIEKGHVVGYLTLGDAMTYSTWIYTIEAVKNVGPNIEVGTIPGVTSFSAVAAASNWPLGEQKERMLILPCPDEPEELRKVIETHDVVVLMKIGKRMPGVLQILGEMGILKHCALGHKVGMPGGEVWSSLGEGTPPDEQGYFSTMLIRKSP